MIWSFETAQTETISPIVITVIFDYSFETWNRWSRMLWRIYLAYKLNDKVSKTDTMPSYKTL